MVRISKNTCLGFIIGYLCLFMALIPCRVNAALLSSQQTPAYSHPRKIEQSVVINRLEQAGLSREEALQRVMLLSRLGIPLEQSPVFIGGEPPQDYDPPINNLGLVFLICGIAIGIGVYAGSRD